MAARYIDNNDGSFTLIGDKGQKQSFMDPDGSFRRELDNISTSTGEIAGASGDATATPDDGAQPPAAPIAQDGFAPMGSAPPGLASNPALNPNAPPGGTAPAPAPIAPAPIAVPPLDQKSTFTSKGPQNSSTYGESIEHKDPSGTIAAAGKKVLASETQANDALAAGKQAALENSGKLITNEMLRAATENAAQTKIANEKEVAMNAALADRKAKRDIPIDPSMAFAGDDGAAAMAATIGMAISNVGLAWMGQSAQPIHMIDNLIDRSVAIQQAQKQQSIEGATESVEMNRAQAAEARANARVALIQQLEAQRAHVDNENSMKMLDYMKADATTKLSRDEMEIAQATADHVVANKSRTSTSAENTTTVTTKPGKSGPQIGAGEKAKLVEKLDGLANAAHGFRELDNAAGIVRDKEGNVVSAGDVVKGSYGVPEAIEDTAGAIPFGIGKELKKTIRGTEPEALKTVRRATEKITTGMAHAQSGAQTTDAELQRYQDRLPLTDSQTFKTSSAELHRELRQNYQNLVGQYGKEYVDEMMHGRGIDTTQWNPGEQGPPPEKF